MKPVINVWLANLASTMETLTGACPRIQPAVPIAAGSLPSELIWWEPDFSDAEPSVWVGVGPSVRRALGFAASGEVISADPGCRGAEQSYQELLQRSWQGVGGALGGGRMTTPPQDAQMFRVVIEGLGTAAMELFAACREAPRDTREAKPERSKQARTGTALDCLLETEIPLSVRFGRARMLLQDIVRLSPGSVVDLNRNMDEQVDLMVNGHLLARGDVVSVQGNYALRITAVRERGRLPERGSSPTVEFSKGAR